MPRDRHNDNPLSVVNASNRIVGELLAKPEYRYANPTLLADVVRDTVNRYIDIELEQED